MTRGAGGDGGSKAPIKRNADKTRARILQAATHEFALHGFSGARVDRIIRRARSNPRMLYHYFGDKAALYVAVLEHVLGDLRSEELKLDFAHMSPLDGLLKMFDFIHQHFGAHPELIHLLSGENLLRARFLKQSKNAPVVSSPVIAVIQGLLDRGVQGGVFRKNIDALHLYVIMVSLSYFHRSNAHTLSAIFQVDLLSEPWQRSHFEAGSQMLERFVRKDP
jgi:AcrR family transcriptional regulator